MYTFLFTEEQRYWESLNVYLAGKCSFRELNNIPKDLPCPIFDNFPSRLEKNKTLLNFTYCVYVFWLWILAGVSYSTDNARRERYNINVTYLKPYTKELVLYAY